MFGRFSRSLEGVARRQFNRRSHRIIGARAPSNQRFSAALGNGKSFSL
jgi:hypothetical protein